MSSSPAVAPVSTPTERVRRDDQKVWIEGVEGFGPGAYASSVQGVQARICQSLGIPLTYEQLICYGGLAFRVQVHETMCPSAAHPGPGYTCMENSNRALPWKMRFFDAMSANKRTAEEQAAFEREACAAIKASIDRGIPVHYGSEEDGLIIGYADDGRRWWCVHPYYKQGKEGFWYDQGTGMAGGSKWPWGIAVWTSPKAAGECASKRELTVAALKQAVDMWRTEKRGDYFVGDAAYAHWIGWLGDVNAGRVKDPKGGMQGNYWCYDTLISYRMAAAGWLRQSAEDFPGPARQQLLLAAGHYARIAQCCRNGVKFPWDVAPGPDRYESWTSAMRKDEIARLEAARQHDRAAVAAIQSALATLDPGDR